MSNAKICDRCGRVIHSEKPFTKYAFVRVRPVHYALDVSRFVGEEDGYNHVFDICNDCIDALDKFLNTGMEGYDG